MDSLLQFSWEKMQKVLFSGQNSQANGDQRSKNRDSLLEVIMNEKVTGKA